MQQINLGERWVTPSKIVCVGRNYLAHIEEMNSELAEQMVLFAKPNSAIANELVAFQDEAIHYEGEICFVYEQGRFSAVGFGFDLTKRQLQRKLKQKGLPWERAKAFNGAAVFSQFVEIAEMSEDFSFELTRNEAIVQKANITLMIYKPAEILSEIQTFMTLNDGDLVMTGTPKGVGQFEQGDKFHVQLKHHNKIMIEATWVAG